MIDDLAKAALAVGGKVARFTDRPPKITAPPPPPATIQARMASGEHRHDAAQFPANGDTPQVRQRVLDFLRDCELITLYTVGQAGWPVGHCMHFATPSGPDLRPVAYLFTQNNTRKLANIHEDPRVGLTAFRPEVTGNAQRTPRLELRGLCSQVTDEDERYFAMLCQFYKPGYEFARLIGLEKQPALRIDLMSAVWDDRAAGQAPLSIDYQAS